MTDAPTPPESFEGFSQRFADFPDYILKITKDIWEGREIGSLNRLYAPDIPMRFPQGVSMGNQATIDGTMATLAEFPDRTLYGRDVVWCGNEEDGYLSSHRIISTGTHLGRGPFAHLLTNGQPSGKRFSMRAIADCAAKNDVIYDEWLIRDTGALVRQLGGDPERFAFDQMMDEGGPEACTKPYTPENDVPGDYEISYGEDGTVRGNAAEWGERYAHILERIMAKDFDVIQREYDRACMVETPGGAIDYSWDAADRFWLALRSSFPRAEFTIHHAIGRHDDLIGPRAAIRWSLWGKHDGWGTFGRPSGAMVHVMGISHAEFGPWGLRTESTLYDEVPVWKQIHMHAAG